MSGHTPSILGTVGLVAAGVLTAIVMAGVAQGQTSTTATPPVSGTVYNLFLAPAIPGRLDFTTFGGGFASDKYGTTQEGLQLEQSLTKGIGLVGRATGYQVYMGSGFDNPLNPGTGHHARFNFGRLQAGLDFAPVIGTNFYLLGGGDVGDSDAGVIEGDISSWLLLHSFHPVNLFISSNHDFENRVTSSEIDLRMILLSTESYMVLGGAGGAIYGGGFIPGVEGQGGPILGLYLRRWRLGFDAQAGYGSAHQYGQLSVFKQFSWAE